MSEQGTNQIQQLQVPPAQDFDTANFQGSMQEVLHENIGKYVLVDFLIGTSNLVTRQGFLYYVGTQFIVFGLLGEMIAHHAHLSNAGGRPTDYSIRRVLRHDSSADA